MKKDKGKAPHSLQSLKNEFAEIEKELKDTKIDWKKRSEALQKCQDILNSDYSDEPYFSGAFEDLADCIGIQLTDLRSGIVKQASHLISDAAELLADGIEGFAERILLGGKVLAQIKSGNKIVSELAHGCVLSILQNSVIQKSIPTIVGEVSSKNGVARAKISEYISIMLQNYPDEVLDRHMDVIGKGVGKALQDANPQARDFARASLNVIEERFPQEAKRIFEKLDTTTKKQLSLKTEPSNQGAINQRGSTPPKKASKVVNKSDNKPTGISQPKSGTQASRQGTRHANESEDENDDDQENSDYSDRRTNATRSEISSKNNKVRNSTQKAPSQVRANSRINSAVDRNKSKTIPRQKGSPERITAKTSSGLTNTDKQKRIKDAGKTSTTSGVKGNTTKSAGQKNFYGEAKLEELQDLMNQLSDENWAVRAKNFNEISELLKECSDDRSVVIPDAFLKTLFKAMVNKFTDIHIKVQVASLGVLDENFELFSKLVPEKSSDLLQKIIECLAETKDNVRQLGGNLLQKFTKEFTEKEVLELIMKIINQFDKVKSQLKSLELMDQIIGMMKNEDYTGSIVKSVVNKLVYIFKDKMRDKDFTKTILSALTKSFEKNSEQSNEFFCLLSPSLQNKVIEFAEKNDPDFLMVFESHQTMDYQDQEKASSEEDAFSKQSTKVTQKSSHNKSELPVSQKGQPGIKQRSTNQGMSEPVGSNQRKKPNQKQIQFENEYSEDEPSDDDYQNFNESRGVRQSQIRAKKTQANQNPTQSKNRDNLNSKKLNTTADRLDSDQTSETQSQTKKTRKIDLNVDLIDPSDIEQIAKTLELLAKKLNQLKDSNKMMELKNLLIMAFPYMVKVLSFEIEDVHNFCFDLIQSTYGYFNLCNDAYSLVLTNLLDLFQSNHSDIDLLHEAADLIIFFPFRQELMKQLLEKLEESVSPSLQLHLKLMVSILSAANGGEIEIEDFRKGFMPILGRLVFYLTKHINNPNPEVRKGVVFILVELHFFLEEDDFMNIMSTFNNSQQKLVFIYVQKKEQQARQLIGEFFCNFLCELHSNRQYNTPDQQLQENKILRNPEFQIFEFQAIN